MDREREQRQIELDRLKVKVQQLTETSLYAYRLENHYQMVFGEGNIFATVMLIGEAPGKSEALAGRPFVGAAGQVLNELLESIGLTRGDVYITNVVKDRPPQNRAPSPEEVQQYAPFLREQIAIIRPRVIVTLGRFAMDFILVYFDLDQQGKKIGELHGRLIDAGAGYGKVSILPMYHPAAGFYDPVVKEALWEDIRALKPFTQVEK